MMRATEKPKCITAKMFQLVGGFGQHEVDRTLRVAAITVAHDAGSYQLVESGPQPGKSFFDGLHFLAQAVVL